MLDVTLLDFSRHGYRQMLTALTGRWNEKEGMWEFNKGRITNINIINGTTTSASFDRYLYPFTRDPIEAGPAAHRCQHHDRGSGPDGRAPAAGGQ